MTLTRAAEPSGCIEDLPRQYRQDNPILGGKRLWGCKLLSCHLPSGAAIGHMLLTGTDRASSSCLLEDLYSRACIIKCSVCQLKQVLSRYLLQLQYAEHLSEPLSRFNSSTESGEHLQKDEVIIPWISCS